MKAKVIGVYKIVTKNNGKVYIGSSGDVIKRFGTHLSRMKRNVHHSPYLQNTYNKYGIDNIELSVIEELPTINTQLEREQYWMDFYKSYNRKYGYNVSKIAGLNDTGKVKVHQYTLEGNYIREWESLKEASVTHNVTSVGSAMNSKYGRVQAAGYQWRYFKVDKLDSVLTIYCSYDKSGKFVKLYTNVVEVKKEYGKVNIHDSIAKINMTAGGMYWRKYHSYNFPKTIEILPRNQAYKKISQFTKDGKFVRSYDSITEAANTIGVKLFQISRVIGGKKTKYKTCAGFRWEYTQKETIMNEVKAVTE